MSKIDEHDWAELEFVVEDGPRVDISWCHRCGTLRMEQISYKDELVAKYWVPGIKPMPDDYAFAHQGLSRDQGCK